MIDVRREQFLVSISDTKFDIDKDFRPGDKTKLFSYKSFWIVEPRKGVNEAIKKKICPRPLEFLAQSSYISIVQDQYIF